MALWAGPGPQGRAKAWAAGSGCALQHPSLGWLPRWPLAQPHSSQCDPLGHMPDPAVPSGHPSVGGTRAGTCLGRRPQTLLALATLPLARWPGSGMARTLEPDPASPRCLDLGSVRCGSGSFYSTDPCEDQGACAGQELRGAQGHVGPTPRRLPGSVARRGVLPAPIADSTV